MSAAAPLPGRSARVSHFVATACARYHLDPAGLAGALAIPVITAAPPPPPRGTLVALPDWASAIGVEGALLVPDHLVAAGTAPCWQRTDWLGAIAWYLDGAAERAAEARNGPIHSYAGRLTGWDTRFWDAAWVNRIVLFLGRWAARRGVSADPRVPAAEVTLSHDVDAVRKTTAIRIKQSAVHLIKALRQLRGGRPVGALRGVGRAVRFFVGPGVGYWNLDRLIAEQRALGLDPIVFVHGGGPPRRPVTWLFDPGYRVADPVPGESLHRLASAGVRVGVHPSFTAWADPAALDRERRAVEAAIGRPVGDCRQHWLRFSWAATWRAQVAAGLTHDWTCGFNDRPGFRLGAALAVRPWGDAEALALTATPTVLMDAQLYDYQELDDARRRAAIARWIGEVQAVGGQAAVIWHQRVVGPDYGWDDGLRALREVLTEGAARRP